MKQERETVMEGDYSPETLAQDPRFILVKDRVATASSLELGDILPSEDLIKASIVQRTAQIYSPFFRYPPDVPVGQLPLEKLGIGLEDKMLGITKSPKETTRYFATEGGRIKNRIAELFPEYASIVEKLITDGKIVNSGSEYGHTQIVMLVEMDRLIGQMVWRLNGHPDRVEGHIAYDFRKRIYDRLRILGVPLKSMVSYSGDERQMVIPKAEESDLVKEDGINKESLEEALSPLSPSQLKDWEFMRGAVFLLNDPRIREVLEANKDARFRGIKRAVDQRIDNLKRTAAYSKR